MIGRYRMENSKLGIRIILLIILDSILINFSYMFSLWLRFDGKIDLRYIEVISDNYLVFTLIKILVIGFFGVYKSLWKYASIFELFQVVYAMIVGNLIVLSYILFTGAYLPRSVYIMNTILDIILIVSSRFSYRVLRRIKNGELLFKHKAKKVLVIGAGSAGASIIKEYKKNLFLNSYVVALIDDDVNKIGKRINGVPIVGNRDAIVRTCEKYNIDEIIISIPSANNKEIREISQICKDTQCKLLTLPNLSDLIEGKVSINSIRPVQIEDLLGRDEVNLDIDEISGFIDDKNIVVTGGGGSIGSEIVRQLLKFSPRKIILLDVYENCLYDLQNEIKGISKDIIIESSIASVRDYKRLDCIFKENDIDIVFHAAAHKHVPLMEHSPGESIKNNVIGTYNIASCAHENKVDRFVMISTDKAVNPTNIMGATKRFAEMIVQSLNEISPTEFVAVRFGNVLGSNGSVVPLFKRQIEKGGPITVTHPEITRYFMTIPEASQLVIQAGAMAKGGEIFVLDMGEPVKILDLAKDLITLSGYKPYDDIPIMITGLRPGEKLYEELLMAEEGLSSTAHNKIFVGAPTFTNLEVVEERIERFKSLLDNCEDSELIDIMAEYIDTYKPNRNGV
jgi:FlaA1/EpsC-like NDP-sugar epimerase